MLLYICTSVNTMCRDNQRQYLKYGKTSCSLVSQDLVAGLKKALSGDLEVLLLDLLMPSLHYEAQRLHQAMVVSGRLCVCVNTWGGLGLEFYATVVSYDILH